jgi:hypothetical protein
MFYDTDFPLSSLHDYKTNKHLNYLIHDEKLSSVDITLILSLYNITYDKDHIP